MEMVDYNLVWLGAGVCTVALTGLIASRRVWRAKPLGVRLGVWLFAGLLCFGGSQILGKGLIGWWPVQGRPDFSTRLVRVEIAPSSGRIALIAFAGFTGVRRGSATKLFVADRDGEEIVEVCSGPVLDIRWGADGRRLYVLRSELARKGSSSRSLWRYTSSTGQLARLRELPRLATLICLDPAEETLLFTGSGFAKGEERFPVVEGLINDERRDRTVCWREGLQIGHAWGPKTGKMFVATSRSSSFGDSYGLWMIEGDGTGLSEPLTLLEMQGIEGIRFNPTETCAALFVRSWPPRMLGFDLYVLDLKEGAAVPLAPGVEWGAGVWDANGKRLVFGDRDGLWSYTVSTGRVRFLVEAPPSRLNPQRRETLKPLACTLSGDILYQKGLWRVEKLSRRSGNAKTLFHTGKLRRYFES